MNGKIVLYVSVIICIGAYFLNSQLSSAIVKQLFSFFKDNKNNDKSSPIKVFSKDELLQYKGANGGSIYIALVGNVYDVTRGRKHYGSGGGYQFFAGIDGSKAFVTGEFNKEGLVDDISELSPSQILSLENWKLFYEKDYQYVGRVEGAFYDKSGAELPMLEVYRSKLKVAQVESEIVEKDNHLFPPCNSEWSQAQGGRLWCSTLSGGITRDWVGVPRMYFVAGSSQPRCACVRTTGPPSHDPGDTHKNRGDLDNPNLSQYPNCDATSISCPMPT